MLYKHFTLTVYGNVESMEINDSKPSAGIKGMYTYISYTKN